ncbi:MAG: hypothetical protein J7E03_06990 [Escherichia coli]|nr:hypothetical protein [Escherichia coli]
MDEKQARETEAEETREEESGDAAEEETAAEQQQEAEEHDWGAMTARIDALEQQVQGLTAAMATISAAAEGEDGKPDADMPDEEYGAALDLDDEDLAGMLGL